jgi:3-dehydroquinate dehydratase-2
MKITVINGPNMAQLGKRDPLHYGTLSLEQLEEYIMEEGKRYGMEVTCHQSDIEGEIVQLIHKAAQHSEGIILNAAAYTHTSVAIRDAVECCGVPVVEVHLSNPQAREPFRHRSILAGACAGTISGFGKESYLLALLWFQRYKKST